MTRVVNVHWMAGANVGDRECGPARYLWGGRVPEQHMDGAWPRGAAVIIGGGGLCHPSLSAIIARRIRESRPGKVIVWAVGANTHGAAAIGDYPAWVLRADFVGVRDWLPGRGLRWVPCASCLSPEFARAAALPAQHAVIGYWHHEWPAPVTGIPLALTNACASLQRAATFLAGGETVLTNTYHGAYWATLLGRRVVIVDPFSNRFLAMRHAPQICTAADWREAARRALAYPEALDECRAATRAFAVDVADVLREEQSV